MHALLIELLQFLYSGAYRGDLTVDLEAKSRETVIRGIAENRCDSRSQPAHDVRHVVNTLPHDRQRLREHGRVDFAFQEPQLRLQSVAFALEPTEEPGKFAAQTVAANEADGRLSAAEHLLQPQPQLQHFPSGAPIELAANPQRCAIDRSVATNALVNRTQNEDHCDIGRDDGGCEGDEHPGELGHGDHDPVCNFIDPPSSSSFVVPRRTQVHRQSTLRNGQLLGFDICAPELDRLAVHGLEGSEEGHR